MNNYFPHDSNARNHDNIIKLRMRHKASGYGVYFMILERLRESENYMSVKDYNVIAFDLREDAALIKSVIEDFGLFTFTEDGKCFYSEELTERMLVKDSARKKMSEASKKRWEKDNDQVSTDIGSYNYQVSTDIGSYNNQESTLCNKSKEKESKEENKEKNTKVFQKKKENIFSPPALEDVRSYILKMGYSVDAERFFDFYESKGWMVGKNKMKNWQAAVRTWTRLDSQRPPDIGVVLTDNSPDKYSESWTR